MGILKEKNISSLVLSKVMSNDQKSKIRLTKTLCVAQESDFAPLFDLIWAKMKNFQTLSHLL